MELASQPNVYMNYEEIFDHSYERVKTTSVGGKTFFAAFYDNFLALSPEIASYFSNVDMKKQIRMMEKSFYSLFIFYATQMRTTILKQPQNDIVKLILVYHSTYLIPGWTQSSRP